MLHALKSLFAGAQDDAGPASALERRHLQVAVAVLLHEARRADYEVGDDETAPALDALAEMFALPRAECERLLEEGRARAAQLSSFYKPVAHVIRAFTVEERVRLVEHLWRVSFADGRLDAFEDHFVRKIAHLLHVPNTQSMLARNRARS